MYLFGAVQAKKTISDHAPILFNCNEDLNFSGEEDGGDYEAFFYGVQLI